MNTKSKQKKWKTKPFSYSETLTLRRAAYPVSNKSVSYQQILLCDFNTNLSRGQLLETRNEL